MAVATDKGALAKASGLAFMADLPFTVLGFRVREMPYTSVDVTQSWALPIIRNMTTNSHQFRVLRVMQDFVHQPLECGFGIISKTTRIIESMTFSRMPHTIGNLMISYLGTHSQATIPKNGKAPISYSAGPVSSCSSGSTSTG